MTQKKVPDMHITWLKELNGEFDKPYMEKLREFLINEKSNNKVTYPPNERVFSSLKFAALDKVKLVIIGQDPYHGLGRQMD